MTTGTSTTLLNCATGTCRCTHGHVNDLVQSSTTAIVGARLSSPRLPPCLCTATGESLEDQGNLHLRHDRDVDDLVQIFDELQLWDLDCLHSCKRICWTCTTTSITLSMCCNGRISMVFCGISGPRESATTEMSTTAQLECPQTAR